MNIDLELFRLIMKYGIYDSEPVLKELYMYDYWGVHVNEIIDTIPKDKVIAIRGNGLHTSELFKLLREDNKNRIKYLIDQHHGDIPEERDIPILLPEEMEYVHIDVILLSTFKWRVEFMAQLMECDDGIEIIDIYDEMEKNGIFFDKEFYTYSVRINKYINYKDTSTTYHKYLCATNEKNKRFYLEKLIAYLVEIRDFITVNKMIDELKRNGWDSENKYEKFRAELVSLFAEIKNIIHKRNKRDIIINYVDNIGADTFYNTKFGKERLADSYCFMNAYTPSPWTYFATRVLITGELPISDHSYKKTTFTDDKSALLRVMKKHNYSFSYIAYGGMYQKWFDNKKVIPKGYTGFDGTIPGSTGGRSERECSTRMQWCSLRERINKPHETVCHLIHSLAESHYPFYYSLTRTLSKKSEDGRIASGIEFILQQLEWYGKFDSAQTVKVCFSDHNCNWGRAYGSETSHVPFVIKGKDFQVKEENRLFSLKDFSKLINAILTLNKSDFDKVFSEHILHENVDYMSENVFDWLFMGDNGDFYISPRMIQCRAIRTLKDLYACYPNGDEYYYCLPNEETNRIDDERFKKRIQELRELCSGDFIDTVRERGYFKASKALNALMQHYMFELK